MDWLASLDSSRDLQPICAKNFINKLHLVLQIDKILSQFFLRLHLPRTKHGLCRPANRIMHEGEKGPPFDLAGFVSAKNGWPADVVRGARVTAWRSESETRKKEQERERRSPRAVFSRLISTLWMTITRVHCWPACDDDGSLECTRCCEEPRCKYGKRTAPGKAEITIYTWAPGAPRRIHLQLSP